MTGSRRWPNKSLLRCKFKRMTPFCPSTRMEIRCLGINRCDMWLVGVFTVGYCLSDSDMLRGLTGVGRLRHEHERVLLGLVSLWYARNLSSPCPLDTTHSFVLQSDCVENDTSGSFAARIPPEPHAALWMSQANVTAHWHYDCSNNWYVVEGHTFRVVCTVRQCVSMCRFVQLQGSKRFLLAPPSAAHSMWLFPSIHPSYHQSQHAPHVYGPLLAGIRPLSFVNSSVEADALSQLQSAAYAVVLHPGDVLYIPRE